MRMLLFLFAGLALNAFAADDDLAAKRWYATETDNFLIYSQLSRGQTERQARALEQWRDAALQVLGVADSQALDPIKTYLYLFDDADDFALFADGEDLAYFFSSPRANFIIARSSDEGIDMAQHHYAHFLINNRPIGVPRWYEEGMSQYLSRLEAGGRTIELHRLTQDNYSLLAALNSDLTLEELIFDDSSLASPRLIQIANLKTAVFTQFLLHGHEREGFADRRQALRNYLGFLQQGRTERFAYDQAFNMSASRLESEFTRFVEEAARRGDRDSDLFESALERSFSAEEVSRVEMELALAEISLHSARFPLSAYYFDGLMQKGEGGGRAYSGYADAQRMNMSNPSDTAEHSALLELAMLYQQAIEIDPGDFQLHLDFGQYYDAQREDCGRPLNSAELVAAQQAMATHFEHALALNPESAEVNLSYAQLFLFEGKDWLQGLEYQNKAFASLPADNFVMEQAIEYAILAQDYPTAEALINRMARPMHFWGTPPWISNLRSQLRAAQRGEIFDPCAEVSE